jgi:hypothetical protein
MFRFTKSDVPAQKQGQQFSAMWKMETTFTKDIRLKIL